MESLKYKTDINPFGILYNPISIANSLQILLDKREFSENDLIYADGLWHSFYHHSRFSFQQKNDVLQAINERISYSGDFLCSSGILFISFGSAYVYEYRENGLIVSNCHKIPERNFNRYKLNVDQIVNEYVRLISLLLEVNPQIKIVFTVSPIRHWSDGAIENQRSKAVLILAIEHINKYFGEKYCTYFPSYEIMMDELRDYRFYTGDMIHVSETALNYIWKVFEKKLIEPESIAISRQVQKLLHALNHKPFNRETAEHLRFLVSTLRLAENIQDQNINLEHEVDFLRSEITEIRRFVKQD